MDAVVYIIDDDDEVRTALDCLFRSVNLKTCQHRSAQEFLDAALPDCPSCLVLDIRLPGISGLELQERLARQNVHIPVVLMTGHGDVPMSVRGMKAGAVDFLMKPFRDQDMLEAVSIAIERNRALRSEERRSEEMRGRFSTLSARERQVMALVTTGKMNKQVSAALNISEVTVKIHRGRVMQKMGARTLAELVHMSRSLGLASDSGPPGKTAV